MKYSPSTGGFYLPEIHGGSIPADAVDITQDEHMSLLAGQAQGRKIEADATGRPVLSAPYVPTPTDLIAAHNAPILAQIVAVESRQHRALREAALNMAGAWARLQAIDGEIAALRAQLQ